MKLRSPGSAILLKGIAQYANQEIGVPGEPEHRFAHPTSG
jgi:hypothetical protein